jgi:hypothetical protein
MDEEEGTELVTPWIETSCNDATTHPKKLALLSMFDIKTNNIVDI